MKMEAPMNFKMMNGSKTYFVKNLSIGLGVYLVAAIILPNPTFSQGNLTEQDKEIVSPLSPPVDDTAQFVMEEQRKPAEPIAITQVGAEKALRDFMRKKGWKENWDNKKNRTMVIATVREKIDSTDPDFLEKREFLAIEALLMGKAKIIESFITNASASNILSVPGNPIEKQLKKEQKEYQAKLKQAREQLAIAQQESALIAELVDQQTADLLSGANMEDKKGSFLDAIIKRIDESYDKNAVNDEKAQKLDELKQRLELANKSKNRASELENEIQSKIEEMQGSVKKELTKTIETISEMPIFGATVLQQIESYDPIRGYELSNLVIWSPKLESEARSALLMENKNISKDSNSSDEFDNWLRSKNLSYMVGPRRFKASDGTVYFSGISAMSYDPDIDDRADVAVEVEAWAKQQALLSLVGDMKSYKRFESRKQEIRNSEGKTDTKILKDASREMSNEVKDVQIRGLEVRSPEELTHPASGQNILVAVAYVNSALASQAGNLMSETYATLREINASQSFMKGEVEGMKAKANETKNDPNMYKQGYSEGQQSVQNNYNERNFDPSNSSANQNSNSSSQSTQGSASGTWGDDTVDDDF